VLWAALVFWLLGGKLYKSAGTRCSAPCPQRANKPASSHKNMYRAGVRHRYPSRVMCIGNKKQGGAPCRLVCTSPNLPRKPDTRLNRGV
jgi:hypothetical protein